jgi:hypothetical protein
MGMAALSVEEVGRQLPRKAAVTAYGNPNAILKIKGET